MQALLCRWGRPVAQWSRRLTADRKVLGSIPGRVMVISSGLTNSPISLPYSPLHGCAIRSKALSPCLYQSCRSSVPLDHGDLWVRVCLAAREVRTTKNNSKRIMELGSALGRGHYLLPSESISTELHYYLQVYDNQRVWQLS